MLVLFAVLGLALSASAFPFSGTVQSVAVHGKLLCNGKPYEHAKIKLFDVDFGLPDDLMAEVRSKADGSFSVEGSETEWTTIDPKINIYHNCNDENKEGWRKVQVEIPKEFITEGEKAAKSFNLGVLNISGVLPGETRDYIN